ncbi:MAG: hypothetical protein WCK47_10600 [bacterium]|nr:hypothetical protein [Candidatus Sumerlaeota bacterium]
MIPSFVKLIALATTVASVAVASCWALCDGRAALAFLLAACWSLANLFVWTGLTLAAIRSGKRNPFVVLGWIGGKFALLGGGFAALVAASPMRIAVGLAVLAGVSVLFAVALLIALFFLTLNIDLMDGKKKIATLELTKTRQSKSD